MKSQSLIREPLSVDSRIPGSFAHTVYSDRSLIRPMGRNLTRLLSVLLLLLAISFSIPSFGQAQSTGLQELDDALDLHMSENYNEAIAGYTDVIKKNPRSAEAYNWRGMAYEEVGELDRAVTDLNEAVKISPNYADAYNNLGEVYRKKKQYAQAAINYKKAISIDPNFAEAHYNMGLIYEFVEKNIPQAIQEYESYLKFNPKASDKDEVNEKIKALRAKAPATPKPGAKPAQPPAAAGTKPGQKPPATAAKPGQPGAKPEQPGRQPGAKPGQPAKQQPGQQAQAAKPAQPGAKPGQPGQQAAAKPGQPAAKPGQPGAKPGAKKPGMAAVAAKPAVPEYIPKDMPGADILNPILADVNKVVDLTILGAALGVLYVFCAAMIFLIAQKTSTARPWLAFIPIAQYVLVADIARKPVFWAILLLIPILNIVAWIIMSIDMARIREKPALWGIITGLFPPVGLAYLALTK